MTTDAPVRTQALRVSGLTVSAATDRGRFVVVNDVSFDLFRGRVTGLAGESGSGKTVTALALMQLLEPRVLKVESGAVEHGSTDLLSLRRERLRAARGNTISMVFQEPMTSLDPMFTVGTSISEVIRSHQKVGRATAKAKTIELLGRVGIPEPEKRFNLYPFQMSGGQLQRVLIAMAISCEPSVLIADEPTTALDVTVQAQIMQLLRSLADDGMAILLVTHDMGVISEYTDDLMVMYAGQLIESGSTADVIENPRHPYTSGLLASVPSTQFRAARLPSISGSVPMLHEMPDGCRFAPRCAFATDACEQPTVLSEVGDHRFSRCTRTAELTLKGVE